MATFEEAITVAVPPNVCWDYLLEHDSRIDHLWHKLFQVTESGTVTADPDEMTITVSHSETCWLVTYQTCTTIHLTPHRRGTRAEITVEHACEWLDFLTIFPINLFAKQQVLHIADTLVALERGFASASTNGIPVAQFDSSWPED